LKRLFVLTPQAKSDLKNIFLDVAEDSFDTAETLLHLTIPPRDISPEERKLIDLRSRLVEDYEHRSRAGKVKHFTPLETLQILVEDQRLKQAVPVDIFGTQSVVSEVLNGRRRINHTQARRLATRFHLSIEVFLP